MEHADLLRHLVETFERLELPYLVTGSTATIAYGEPRFTNDIDVVVDLPASKIDELLAAFPDEQFYVSRSAVEAAIARHHQFNIIHPTSGLKADVIVASQSEFDRSRLRRVRRLPVLEDRDVSFASPEDVILKKMVYFQEGGSDKHMRDIAGVVSIQGEKLDRQYIENLAGQLGLAEIWSQVLERIANQTKETGSDTQ
jgi:hypothetical protein